MLKDNDRRPCHSHGCNPNPCAAAHYRLIVDNHVALSGPWAGWRLAGRDLLALDRQRIGPERLRGLMFRDASERRLSVNRTKANTRSCQIVSLLAREQLNGRP